MVAGRADRIDGAWNRRRTDPGVGGVGGAGEVQVRVAAVVVEEVGTELGVVHFRHEPAQGHAELAAVLGVLGLGARHEGVIHAAALGARARHRKARTCVVGHARRQVETGDHRPVVAAFRGNVVTEEGAAVVDHRVLPFQLVEGFGGDVFGQALGHVQQVDRNQAFLDFGTRAAQGGGVDRVDAVDRVADEGALAPTDHLLAQAHVAGQFTEVVVVVDEAVEEHRPGRLGGAVAAMVVDVVERTAFVHQLEVVPVLAAHEGAAVAVFQLQVMHALEDLREGLALLEVQAVVIAGPRGSLAVGALRVEVGDEIRIRTAYRPARPHRQRRIETPLQFADVEVDGIGLRTDPQGDSCRQ
ncbi:hypothetical protein D9M71_170650 [compost metagenome]